MLLTGSRDMHFEVSDAQAPVQCACTVYSRREWPRKDLLCQRPCFLLLDSAYFPIALHFEGVCFFSFFLFRDLWCCLQLISSRIHLHLLARCFICGFWDHDARSLWSAVHPVPVPLCVIPLPGREDRPHSKWCALPWNRELEESQAVTAREGRGGQKPCP